MSIEFKEYTETPTGTIEITPQQEEQSVDVTEYSTAQVGAAPVISVNNRTGAVTGLQEQISDLSTIRAGAQLGATAVQPESGKGLFSGNYNDLTNTPTIPTNTNQLTNGAGFITSGGSCNYATSAGSAGSSSISSTMVGSYTGNGGQQGPSYFGVNKVGCLMMNTPVNGDSHYKDWLIMDAYSGSDVGGGTAIGVDRQEMRAFIMGSDASRGSWSRSAELITSANIGSQSVKYASSAGSAPANGGTSTYTNYVNNDSASMRMHWSGQSGQPTWLWGANSAGDTYVWNPANFSVNYADSCRYASSASNSDTVDGYHASSFAFQGSHNNLTASGNEFTFAPSGFSGAIYINYRTAGGTNGNITDYVLCNGATGNLGYAATKPTLLWSNGSPTSEFPSQNLSLYTYSYSFLIIECEWATNSTGQRSWQLVKNDNGMAGTVYLIDYDTNQHVFRRFIVYPSSSYIAWGTGYITSTATAGSATNARCIPYRIWGIR